MPHSTRAATSQGRDAMRPIENIREAMTLYVEALEGDYLSWRATRRLAAGWWLS